MSCVLLLLAANIGETVEREASKQLLVHFFFVTLLLETLLLLPYWAAWVGNAHLLQYA